MTHRHNSSPEAMTHISESQKTRANMARNILSESVSKAVQDMKQFLSALRTGGLTLKDKLQHLQSEMEAIWTNVLNEYTTALFYLKVHEDYVTFLNNSAFYLPYSDGLLDIKLTELVNLSAADAEYRHNADFSIINIEDEKPIVENNFPI